MPDPLCIALPWQPQPEVAPNNKRHPRTVSHHHRQNAEVAALAVRSHMAREVPPWTVPDTPALDVTVHWGKHRNRHDLDGLISCCKGVIDGVTRELGFDDRRLVAITVAQGRDPDKLGYTTVCIREATSEERLRAA